MRAILIDDEPLALEFLENRINHVSDIQIAGKFTHFYPDQEAELLKEVQIVFLDIEMPGISGLELAEKILEFNSELTIVFVTAHKEYAADAFELNALDYLLKPVQIDRLEKTIERIKQNVKSEQDIALNKDQLLTLSVCNDLTFHYPDGKTVVIPWRTSKAQELFLYLLQHRFETVRKSKLVDVLWPDLSEQRGYSQLYTTVYHVRKALQPFHNHFSLENVLGGYILQTENVRIDLEEWVQTMATLPPLANNTVSVYEEAMNGYRGAYLDDFAYLWAESERLRLEQLWLKHAYQIASYYYDNHQLEQAEKWFVEISKVQPEDETASFALMKIYDSLGLGLLISHQYNRLSQALDDLDIDMNPDIKKWFEELHQKNSF